MSVLSRIARRSTPRKAGKLPILLLVAVSLLWASAKGSAQQVDQIAGQQQAKLEDAIRRLNEQRTKIQNTQIPLSKSLSELRVESKALESQLAERRRVRDSASVSLEQLRVRVADGRREYEYISGALFSEFVSSFKSALSPAEMTTFGETIREHDLLLERSEASEAEKLDASLNLLSESLERLDDLLGGKTYPGNALTGDGRQQGGKFVQVGPLLYFASDAGEAGWVEETKTFQPRMRPVDETEGAMIKGVAMSGSGLLPVDSSLGDAVALAETKETLGEHLEKGGIWVYPIVGFAVIATLAAIFKFLQVFLIRQPRPMVVHEIVRFLRDGNKEAARGLAWAQPQPAADMLVAAVEHSDESIELVEEVMYESMLNTQPRLERFLNVIAVTAATAPLLGLLGTVTGIIKTFKLMEIFGAGDPKPLISGISEALITTELGLVLAIPALIAHALLSRRVAGVLARLEKLSVEFVNGLSRRPAGGANPPSPSNSPQNSPVPAGNAR